MRKFLTILSGALIIVLLAGAAMAQHVVGTINATGYWNRIELYQTGEKLFIADNTNAQILVYDANSLGYLNTISLSSFLPKRPQTMAVHNGTGTLYVAVSTGMATSDSTIVIINAATNSIVGTITNIGRNIALGIDESRARLYTLGYISFAGNILTAINCTTNGIVGSLNITSLMGFGILVRSTDSWLNPLTGELVIGNLHYNEFVVVNGPAMTGELISATKSRGWDCAWNPQENKIYITTANWGGYFIYDRDTKTSTTAGCINDGTSLFYSPLKNRIYTGAEVNGDATVIEGASDACQNVHVWPGQAYVGFVEATHHAYFLGAKSISVLDENTLTVVATISNCNPDAYGSVSLQVIVNQAKGRVFTRSFWSSGESEGSCVLVIDDEDNKPKLTIQSSQYGTTNPTPGTYSYDQGSQVQVTAIPNTNCEFVNWTGDISSPQNPATVTINGNMTIKANFRLKPKLTIQPASNGTTNPSPGVYYYATGTQVQISPIPNTYFTFTSWSGSATGSAEPLVVSMTGDKTISASFRYIYAPIATGQKVLNRNFSYAEYVNVLSWGANPANEGLDIAKFRIYTVSGDTFTMLAEITSDHIVYYHHKAGQTSIQYAITAVTSGGREGEPALVTVQ